MRQTLEFFAVLGYGTFPYIIIREMIGMYRQIPIHCSIQELLEREGVLVNISEDESEDVFEEKCLDTLKRIITSQDVITIKRNIEENWIFLDNRKIEGCVVFSPNRAIYLDSGGNIKSESKSIPWGGTLVSMCGEKIITSCRHYNFLQS